MQSFQERFKYKSSTIGKRGEVDVKPARAIIKPDINQIHSPVIKSSAKTIVESHQSEKKDVLRIPNSASPSISPKRKASPPKRQISQAPPMSLMGPLEDSFPQQRNLDFVPYTITDYSFIKNNKYYELGGLGAATIGTEEWMKRKRVSDKRKNYANQIILITPREPGVNESSADKQEKNKNRSVAHTRNSTSLT